MSDADLDAVARELANVQDALLALPDDAFAERFELLKRRDALRARAGAFAGEWDASRPTADLRAELAALRARRDSIERQRIDMVSQSGGGGQGSGADGWGGVVLNQKISQAHGLGDIEGRIGRIVGILIDRGEEPGLVGER